MKKNLLLGAFILFSCLNAQIGIKTSTPTNSLDINGDVRIRKIDNTSSTPTHVLVPDQNGVIYKHPYSGFNPNEGSLIKKLQYSGAADPSKTTTNGPFEFRMLQNGSGELIYQARLMVKPIGSVFMYISKLVGWGESPGGQRNTLTYTILNWNSWQEIGKILIAKNGHNVLITTNFNNSNNISTTPITYNIFAQRIDEDGGIKTLIISQY